ncbi:MAG: DNA cytosine methyltransferase [Saprospiraceae bacterium]|nr:DNA cytosine methyltransferase [Saprospiraceae bacterium]
MPIKEMDLGTKLSRMMELQMLLYVVGWAGKEIWYMMIDWKILRQTTKITGEVNREYIRKMTPREWARLQGFPDEFLIPVADASAYKQFGNSVAVPAIKATANEIIKCLNLIK